MRAALVSHHIRHAGRLLVRHPGTSLLAILALGTGIGLTATTFSLVSGLLLRGLPVEHGDRFVYVASTDATRRVPLYRMMPRDLADLRAAQKSFDLLAPFNYRSVNLSDDVAFPERRSGCFVAPEILASLGIEPRLGRALTADDDVPGAPLVALIGHDLWQRRFEGDPGVLGREVRVDGENAVVVGVMPPGFAFPLREELWMPLRLDPDRVEWDAGPPVRALGRLRAGVGAEEARAELASLAERLAADHPDTHGGRGVYVMPITRHFMWPQLRQSLWALLALVGLGLLLACANVASLLVARAAGRLRELATLTALGASRGSVMAYVLSESFLLSGLGAVVGLGLAVAGVRALASQYGWVRLPYWMAITLDARAVGFAVFVTLLTAQVAGLYPAWSATRLDVTTFLREARCATGLRTDRFIRGLVIAKIGIAFLLVVCTGLFFRTQLHLDGVALRVGADRVFTAQLELPAGDYPSPADRVAFVDRLVEGVASGLGVERAAVTTHLPLWGFNNLTPYVIEGEAYPTAADYPRTHRVAVTPSFFEALGGSVQQGRGLDRGDRADSLPVAVVNRGFAERAWPRGDAVGRRLRWGPGEDKPWRPVVGVVDDLWPGALDDPDSTGVYVPYSQSGDRIVTILASTRGEPDLLAPLLRREAHALDKSLPLFEVQTLRGALEAEMFHARLFARLMTVLGLVVLVLAAAGIYGINVFAISQRKAEFGLRLALGAQRREVLELVLRQCLWRAVLGLALGLVLVAFVTPSLKWLFVGTAAWDPLTLVATAAFLTAVALLACLLPAARATRIRPIEALRYE